MIVFWSFVYTIEVNVPDPINTTEETSMQNQRQTMLVAEAGSVSNNTHVPLRGKSPSTPKGFLSLVRRKDQEGRPCPFSVAAAIKSMFFLVSTHQGQQQTKEKENAMPQVNRDVNDGNVKYRRRMFRRMNTRGLTKDL